MNLLCKCFINQFDFNFLSPICLSFAIYPTSAPGLEETYAQSKHNICVMPWSCKERKKKTKKPCHLFQQSHLWTREAEECVSSDMQQVRDTRRVCYQCVWRVVRLCWPCCAESSGFGRRQWSTKEAESKIWPAGTSTELAASAENMIWAQQLKGQNMSVQCCQGEKWELTGCFTFFFFFYIRQIWPRRTEACYYKFYCFKFKF